MLTLYGCPSSTKFALGNQNEYKIDTDLLGTWESEDKEMCEVSKVTLKKRDNYLYDITIDEEGEMFAMESKTYVGWITKIDGLDFLCLKGNEAGENLVYHIEKNGKKKLSTIDVTVTDVNTTSEVSTEAYRKDVKTNYKDNIPYIDEVYVYNKK